MCHKGDFWYARKLTTGSVLWPRSHRLMCSSTVGYERRWCSRVVTVVFVSGTVCFWFQGLMPTSHLLKNPFCHNLAYAAYFGAFSLYALLFCFGFGVFIDGMITFLFKWCLHSLTIAISIKCCNPHFSRLNVNRYVQWIFQMSLGFLVCNELDVLTSRFN